MKNKNNEQVKRTTKIIVPKGIFHADDDDEYVGSDGLTSKQRQSMSNKEYYAYQHARGGNSGGIGSIIGAVIVIVIVMSTIGNCIGGC